ncbi:MAG: hypothetical protein IPL46_05755 [Saprospiraceae bacterium]|nr:hypothetical protein [Saprospiraceae bacterium]
MNRKAASMDTALQGEIATAEEQEACCSVVYGTRPVKAAGTNGDEVPTAQVAAVAS